METFEHLLYQLHLSYLQARKNKRNTHNQLQFELNQEENLHQLATSIFERKYTPKSSIAFIIQKPVMREIFAADFTDRVIHHFIYRCIYPEQYRLPDVSVPYQQIDLQITRRWKDVLIYGGIENIFDFRQEFPILGYDQPFGQYFDPAFNWGPTKGRAFYLGVRYSVK